MSDGMLTDMACRKAKCPAEKTKIKITDGSGLYLMVNARGGKYWYLQYRIAGARHEMSLGAYPKVGLLDARNKRDTARSMIKNGIDPRTSPAAVESGASGGMPTFGDLFTDYLQRKGRNLAARTAREMESRIRCHALPVIGDTPIDRITPVIVLQLLRSIEKRGYHHTAHRVQSIIGRVMRYAISCCIIDTDPTASLRGALEPEHVRSRAAIIDPEKIGMLMRAIDGYEGHPAVRCAIKLLPRLFVRPGELRLAEWCEVDLDGATWRVPGDRLKVRQGGDHIVPLSRQAVEVLREMQAYSGERALIMPGIRSGKPLSDNTYNATLRAMGFDGQTQTAHGFRAMAKSQLAEHSWPRDAIERQLAHARKSAVDRAYDRAEHLDLRRTMMQRWSDYLDGLKANDLAAASDALEFRWREK